MDTDSGRSSPVLLAVRPLSTTNVDIGDEGAPVSDVITEQIQNAATALNVLHDSVDEDEILYYLEQLESYVLSGNDHVFGYLEKNHANIHILSVMKHIPSSLLVQQRGLRMLYHLATKSILLMESMIAGDCCSLVIYLLSTHKMDICIQRNGLGLLACFLGTDTCLTNVQNDNHVKDINDVIFHAIETHNKELDLFINVLTALVPFVKIETVPETIIQARHCDLLENRLQDTTRLSAQILLLKTLCVLCNTDNHRQQLTEKGTHLTVMEICSKSQTNEELSAEALDLLSVLCKEDVVQRVLVSYGFVQNKVQTILEAFRLSERIQTVGFRIIETVVPLLMKDENKNEEVSKTIIRLVSVAMLSHIDHPQIQELVYFIPVCKGSGKLCQTFSAAMFSHIDHPLIQIAASKTISTLLEHDPQSSRWIGENADDKQEPVHTLCLGAIMVSKKNGDVFGSVSDAIYWIAADNERLCTSLMNKNGHLAIIEGLKRHRKNSVAVEKGCKALRGLCIFLPQHKTSLVNEGVFDILIDLLQKYKQHLNTQIELISLIASLADIDLVRHQCFVEKFPEFVIDMMKENRDDPVLQEVGLETLAVLSGAEGGLDILLSNGALPVTLGAMDMFKDSALIQKKGLIMLQVFADKQFVQDRRMRKKIADIMISVMKNFSDTKAISSEVCVTIQLMAECDPVMSKEFVDRACHEYLFFMLEDRDIKTGLQELASECLYVLSQEQNLKSVMLLSACKNGKLPATECLIELGADVNIGEGSSTPLYIAVANSREDVVRLLIKQEVQDMQTSLRKSLEQGSDKITGFLLQEMGYDKNSGLISWSGYKLKQLKSSWIWITLTNRPHKDFDTEIGREYLDKIKNSELKRNQRRKLSKSKSDSSLRVAMRLRHMHTANTEGQTIEENVPVSPTTMAVASISPFPTHPIYIRSQSVDRMTASPSPKIARRPTLPTISAMPPDDLEFNLSPTEERVWKENTLTGANIPYSPNDPRQQITESTMEKNQLAVADGSPWMRKRTRSPLCSTSSEDSVSPLGARKASEPDLSQNINQSLQRRKTLGTITDIHIVGTQALATKNKLVQFDLSSTCIHDIEALVSLDLIAYFTKLNILDASSNDIKEIPSNLYKSLPALTNLNLSSNSIDIFPDSILNCEQLAHLDLTHNKIKEIKLQFFCSSLKRLYLAHNSLQILPREIGSYCHNLKELTLNANDLTELPESAIGLKHLRRLDLSKNHIDSVPEHFLQLFQKLEELNLSDNNLSRLPTEAVSSLLPNLTKLKLKNNFLEEKAPFFIPKFILELPSIRSVDLSGNLLKGLPPLLMWKSNMMKDFMASGNRIASLNLDNAKTWNKLEKLHLGKNYLSELPKEIGQLTSLISLDISHNKGIVTLPDELGKCAKIYELNLEGLDLDLDRALLKRRVKDIISYLHNRLKKAQCYYRMKLMVVGYGNRGKTTLIKTLMRRRNSNKKENKATVGVVVRDWTYTRHERRDEDGMWFLGKGFRTEHTLSTWDFAGQEEFYSTHECYLSQRAVYLVVFDLRKGVADVEHLKTWLASIRSHAQHCPVIIVGTHLDKLPKDEVRNREEINKISEKLREFNTQPGLPTIHSDRVFLVDASCENESVDRLRNGIKRTVSEFEIRGKRLMGEKVPASYVKLSDLLTEKAKSMEGTYPVLRHKELKQMVQDSDLNLDGEDELRQAVRFLHGAGVLLHYDDMSMQLRDFYFINPGWLCQMMAQVVTVRQINPFVSNDGIMNKKDIYILFKEKARFPEYLVPQYIKLLEKFEIALPYSETELLIPCKLPAQKPQIRIPDHGKYNTIKRIYSLPHIPIGLRFRLIARLITLTKDLRFQSMLQLDDKPRQICWKTGLYIHWSELAYFLLDSNTSNLDGRKELLHFTVPKSPQGVRLLGQIVDCIDNLIDDWYPGLTNIDPLMGHEILEILAPCTQCTDQIRCHMFSMLDLQRAASVDDKVHCPVHRADILLTDVAPDLVLADVESSLQLDTGSLEYEEIPDKLLGDGGFGDVYHAKYRDKDVAVKLFKEIADVNPLKMLRQEATILRYLNHPSVVSLLAIGTHPPLLLLELAPCGTLGTLIKSHKGIKRDLQHKIALQMTEGLAYLHDIMIVFRDMKPDNVLIFSTSVKDRVIAKISDYGIARFTYLQSLKAQEGTLAYRAPEVIRKENYQSQADIFSLGLTFYVMLSGRHPFDNLDSKGEMDRAISEGLPIRPLSGRLSTPWPDMQTLTLKCLKYSPDERPTARQVYEKLRNAEMYCLQEIFNVSKATTVECLTVQRDVKQSYVKVWIGSGDSENYQLSYITRGASPNRTKGFLFKHGRIMCMETLGDHYLALGTQHGRVWIFDTKACALCHSSAQLQDSVLCMKHSKGEREGGWLLVGLANGKVACFPVDELLSDEGVDPICLYPGHEYEPVLCMLVLGKRVFLSCGSQIIVLTTTKGITIDKILDTMPNRLPHVPPIYTMAVVKGQIIFSKKASSVVEVWDAMKDTIQHKFDVGEILKLPKSGARVTALSADGKSIWIGTHSGHIGIVDMKTQTVLALTHRYERAVRCLHHVYEQGSPKLASVLSGGLGFKDTQSPDKESSTMCGCLLVWDPEFPKYAKGLFEYECQRQELQSKVARKLSQQNNEWRSLENHQAVPRTTSLHEWRGLEHHPPVPRTFSLLERRSLENHPAIPRTISQHERRSPENHHPVPSTSYINVELISHR